jgi:DUF4097 and DUF4098 domain-containing protein YvlB
MLLPMNRQFPLVLILLATLVSGCTPDKFTDMETRIIDVADSQSILIQVDYGEVTILGSDDSKVTIEGQVLFAEKLEYQVNTTQDQIVIKVFAHRDNLSSPSLRLFVHVPKQLQVKIETDKASVLVQGYQGNLRVDSTSGNITVEQMTGALTLHSNRGNISVRDSSGDLSIVGNYGALTMQNTSGETSASTIMGNILFDGLIQAGDKVRLETDHGSVSVKLTADSALGIQVRSTSGDVTCILPGISSTTRTCDGAMNFGGGSLSIRTVSGAVTIQLMP